MSQTLRQHTPSAQKPVEHSSLVVQVPAAAVFALHMPPASQKKPGWQGFWAEQVSLHELFMQVVGQVLGMGGLHVPLLLQLAPGARVCGVSGPSVLTGGGRVGPSFLAGGAAASFLSSGGGSSICWAPGFDEPEPEQAWANMQKKTAVRSLVCDMR